MQPRMQLLTDDKLRTVAPAVFAENPHPDVSNLYQFIPTIEVVDLLRGQGWLPVDARQSKNRLPERTDVAKHMVRFQYGRDGIDITDQERVDLVLFNSHDRGCSFQLKASVWRKVCGNGLMTSTDIYNFSIRHVGRSDEIIEAGKQIADNASILATQVEDLKTIELTPDERGVYAAEAHSLRFDEPEKAPIRPEQLLVERRYDDKGKDLWSTFNVIQENAIKGGQIGFVKGKNGRRRRARTRPIKSIDTDTKLNQSLWRLTEKMAELKNQ